MVPKVGDFVYIKVMKRYDDVTYGPFEVEKVDDIVPPATYRGVTVTIDGESVTFPDCFVYEHDPSTPAAGGGSLKLGLRPGYRLRPGHRTFAFTHNVKNTRTTY